MKKLGLYILIIGLAITTFAGVTFIIKEKVVEIGSLKMTADKNQTLAWSPYLGIGIVAIGMVMYLTGKQNRQL